MMAFLRGVDGSHGAGSHRPAGRWRMRRCPMAYVCRRPRAAPISGGPGDPNRGDVVAARRGTRLTFDDGRRTTRDAAPSSTSSRAEPRPSGVFSSSVAMPPATRTRPPPRDLRRGARPWPITASTIRTSANDAPPPVLGPATRRKPTPAVADVIGPRPAFVPSADGRPHRLPLRPHLRRSGHGAGDPGSHRGARTDSRRRNERIGSAASAFAGPRAGVTSWCWHERGAIRISGRGPVGHGGGGGAADSIGCGQRGA